MAKQRAVAASIALRDASLIGVGAIQMTRPLNVQVCCVAVTASVMELEDVC